jgi:hypothetical protein
VAYSYAIDNALENDMTTAKNLRNMTADELDDIIERTEYAERGVAVGEDAANDQDLRRAAWAEINRRMGYDD